MPRPYGTAGVDDVTTAPAWFPVPGMLDTEELVTVRWDRWRRLAHSGHNEGRE